MNFIKMFKKETNIEPIEITLIDDNKELPDFRKIAIPDLKQHMIESYEETRKLKLEKNELKEELESAKEYKTLYETSLVALNEFKIRDDENKKLQEKTENIIKEKENEIQLLKEQLNDYIIIETETNKKIENIEQIKKESNILAVNKYKDNLILEINNTRGTISKSKLFSIIDSIK